MITNLLTETTEVATEVAETAKNGFIEFVDNIYAWGNWVKPTFFIMSGLFLLLLVSLIIAGIIKGK